MTPRLKDRYENEVLPAMMKKFGYRNRLEVPRLNKIVLNVGLGEGVAEPKSLEVAMISLAAITGQRPVITRAKKSVAGFKIKKGVQLGCKVTLRRERMYEFLDRLVSVNLPRIRDFRGISLRSFDGRGNFSFGIEEQAIFPEIDHEKISLVHGMDIIVVTTAATDEEASALLSLLGMPFKE
ncbi:50S ribosomal protein L5 [candidate division NPL-UPA2 bacterium Unc8]|uniref:Large ribosomal subunit protein uL5 n=1 Tax=candidate division NPL-UPA2 bacterium Unc8 TaxID=1980939 RepID=A0A399FVR9_UNCN2|nr:50S ribosomal protein L5 [Bacillota bacterium]MBT9147238.1 50S ribosomal protein L5 [Bacillota bacterium]RII00294.1 MAG: 50S ribosomal protein L5 [candidate division NPL-UPA2 bacterium Unc8]